MSAYIVQHFILTRLVYLHYTNMCPFTCQYKRSALNTSVCCAGPDLPLVYNSLFTTIFMPITGGDFAHWEIQNANPDFPPVKAHSLPFVLHDLQ